MNKKKLAILSIVALLFILWFSLDLGRFLTLENVKTHQQALSSVIEQNFVLASIGYFLAYILIAALSLPGAALVTLLGAALFGFWWSLLLVSFSSTIGATLAFLVSRFILREPVQAKFANKLAVINQGIEKEGALYLFTLRLIPAFPFFLINLLMGLTPIKTVTFYLVSQIGMLPGTMVYLNAGTQLTQLESLAGILSPSILLSFILIGIFPLIAKVIMNIINKKRLYAKWSKPEHFDRNLIVIGAGSGGLITSYIAAAVKAKVTLIEKHKMGGDCLNSGCVPSKALIRAAHNIHEIKRSEEFGIHCNEAPEVNFAKVMQRIHQVIAKVAPHDSIERYTSLGVECIQGEAKLLSPWLVEVNGLKLSTKNIVIATGAHPLMPAIPGLSEMNALTSDNIWQLETLPQKLLVLGGGPIGCELAQSFARLGSTVTQVEMTDQLLIREDAELAKLVAKGLEKDKVDILLNHKAVRFEKEGTTQRVILDNMLSGEQKTVEFDYVIVALGRVANIQGFGIEELGIELTERKTVKVNQHLQTTYPNIFAVGDVTGPYQLTHAASHQAWYAAVNALFGALKKFKVDYSVLPAATYTSPELARVGISEKEAKALGIDYEVTTYGIDDLDRAIADGEDQGVIKVITPKGKDKILGAAIVGSHAGDLLAEFTLAMRHGIGLNKILATIHPYPTMSEAIKSTAGVWKKAHAPEKLLSYVEKFHDWMRKEKDTNIEGQALSKE